MSKKQVRATVTNALMAEYLDFAAFGRDSLTGRAYEYDLAIFEKWMIGSGFVRGPDLNFSLSAENIIAFLESERDKMASISTLCRRLSVIRMFYDFLVKKNVVAKNPARTAKWRFKRPDPLCVAALPHEIDALMCVLETRLTKADPAHLEYRLRNLIIAHLLAKVGLRVQEIVNAKAGDAREGGIWINARKKTEPLETNIGDMLKKYLERRNVTDPNAPLFDSTMRRGYGISPRAVHKIIANASEAALLKITPKSLYFAHRKAAKPNIGITPQPVAMKKPAMV